VETSNHKSQGEALLLICFFSLFSALSSPHTRASYNKVVMMIFMAFPLCEIKFKFIHRDFAPFASFQLIREARESIAGADSFMSIDSLCSLFLVSVFHSPAKARKR
jgi:hypothetical protein